MKVKFAWKGQSLVYNSATLRQAVCKAKGGVHRVTSGDQEGLIIYPVYFSFALTWNIASISNLQPTPSNFTWFTAGLD